MWYNINMMCHICRSLQKEINKYKFIELSRYYKFHDDAYTMTKQIQFEIKNKILFE